MRSRPVFVSVVSAQQCTTRFLYISSPCTRVLATPIRFACRTGSSRSLVPSGASKLDHGGPGQDRAGGARAMLRAAVVGCGTMGRHLRVLSDLPDVDLVAVADEDPRESRTCRRNTACAPSARTWKCWRRRARTAWSWRCPRSRISPSPWTPSCVASTLCGEAHHVYYRRGRSTVAASAGDRGGAGRRACGALQSCHI